jgi:hypothetical protein
MLQNIYQNEDKTILISEEISKEVLVLKLRGEHSFDDYQSAFERLVRQAKDKGFFKLIYDMRELENTNPTSRAWNVNEYFPKAIDILGQLAVAVIASPNAFINQTSQIIQDTASKKNPKLQIKSFQDVELGLEWLVAYEL